VPVQVFLIFFKDHAQTHLSKWVDLHHRSILTKEELVEILQYMSYLVLLSRVDTQLGCHALKITTNH
jgi:hypothetical protein